MECFFLQGTTHVGVHGKGPLQKFHTEPRSDIPMDFHFRNPTKTWDDQQCAH